MGSAAYRYPARDHGVSVSLADWSIAGLHRRREGERANGYSHGGPARVRAEALVGALVAQPDRIAIEGEPALPPGRRRGQRALSSRAHSRAPGVTAGLTTKGTKRTKKDLSSGTQSRARGIGLERSRRG